jgi:hypothetical protein
VRRRRALKPISRSVGNRSADTREGPDDSRRHRQAWSATRMVPRRTGRCYDIQGSRRAICFARMRSSRVIVALVTVGASVLTVGTAGAAGKRRSVSRYVATIVGSVLPGVPLEMVGQNGMPALVQVENVTVRFVRPASVNYKCSIILRRSGKVVGRGGFGGAVPGGAVSLPVELTIKKPFRGKPSDAQVRCIVEPAEPITSSTAPPGTPTTTVTPNPPPTTAPA